jgi:ankyrin repeat protein
VGKLKLLQRSGANVAGVSNDGTTVLMIAASRYWQPGLLKAVLEMGANPSVRNSQGQTALDLLEQAKTKNDVPAAYQEARALLLQAH